MEFNPEPSKSLETDAERARDRPLQSREPRINFRNPVIGCDDQEAPLELSPQAGLPSSAADG
jgi:hypothetical protein